MKTRRKDLGRIAHATQGEMEVDDLIQEAWIIAAEVADDLGEAFDFSNSEHQDKLLAWMYARFVKFADKTVRYATKLDRGWDDDSEQTAGKAIASRRSPVPPTTAPDFFGAPWAPASILSGRW